MAIKFYMDEHVHPGVAKALEKRGIDVVTAQRAGMLDVDDDEHLQLAASQGRVIFTQDDDFLDDQWTSEMKHSGIAYAPQSMSMREIIEGLVLIYEAVTEDEMKNHVEYL
jgi:predicted nuclease of predicted toxin-antitoxin system